MLVVAVHYNDLGLLQGEVVGEEGAESGLAHAALLIGKRHDDIILHDVQLLRRLLEFFGYVLACVSCAFCVDWVAQVP